MTEQVQVQPAQEQEPKEEPQYVPVDDKPVPIEQYTPEQVASASVELQELTPEGLLNIHGELESLKRVLETENFPEARAIIFAEFLEPGGGKFHATVRAESLVAAWDEMATATKYAHDQFGIKMSRPQPYKPPAQSSQPAVQSPPTVQSQPVSVSPGPKSDNSGTDVLNKIVITHDLKVEFHVGKFKWPFKDSRGAKIVAGLFDESTGFTEEHFSKPGSYQPGQWQGTLLVDWEKPDKYYNITRVYPQQ